MKIKTRKSGKQKSFFFEDYIESEIVVNSKKTNFAKVSLNRTIFLFFIFISLIVIFSIKIIYLSLSHEKNLFLTDTIHYFEKERKDIVDRNGTILARNIEIYSAGVKPNLIKDKKKFLISLRIIFPELKAKKIEEKLNKEKFFYIKKKINRR